LFLRLNLFHDVEAQHVFGALVRFYGERGAAPVDGGLRGERLELYQRRGHWCALDWDRAWEWKLGRDAQLFVSKELGVAGLLILVYEGRYWAYELFRNGEVADRFVQCPPEDADLTWFPGGGNLGDPAAIVACFSELSLADVSPYLVQKPLFGAGHRERFVELHAPVRPGDEFRRFDKLAVFDFLRALGVESPIEEEERWRYGSELFRAFHFRFPP